MTQAVHDLLEQHFDTAFAAPDGIAKLRELILTLAMQGKLVEQDPNDPPARELLKEIEADKQRLIAEKKIKKQKPLPPVKLQEMPYELPHGWEWVRLGDIANINGGFAFKSSKYTSDGIRVIRISDFDERGFKNEKIVRHPYSTDLQDFQLEENNILMAMTGGTVGKSLLVKTMPEPMVVNQRVATIRVHRHVLPDFINGLIRTELVQSVIQSAKNSTNDNISMSDITSFLVPLPPLREQQRIVGRIGELMSRCDELERLHKSREETRMKVHAAAIKQLLDAPENAGWPFIQQHFGELYTVKENVGELRKAILQLAVMGRLVPQDPNDQPASELLKEIEAKKQRMIAEKKIKKQKPLPPIKPEEIPYQLPDGWMWVRFGDIAFQITDGAHHTPTYIEEGIPFLSVKDMSSGSLDFSDTRFISPEQHQELTKRCHPQKGDLLLTKVGTTGIPVLVDVDCEFSIFVSVALIKFPQSLISGKFLSWLVKAPLVKKQSEDGTEGVGNKNLVLRKITNFILPLPSLPEQHRIVSRIDRLTALCDKLDAQIESATNKQKALLNAVMAQV